MFLAAAGDGLCHASVSQAVQWEAEAVVPFSRTQCTDHHGEKRPKQETHFNFSLMLHMQSLIYHLQALYDYIPSENDLQPLLAWLAVMEKAHVNLARY